MDFFVGELTNGIVLGAMYALIALGYSIVYGILKLLNFAHGDVFMVGAFIGFFVEEAFHAPLAPTIPVPLLFVLMFVAAMAGCGVLGVVMERFAYRPLRNAPRIAPLISALGVSFFIENSMLVFFGAQYRTYDTFSLKNGEYVVKGLHWGPVDLSVLRLLTIGLAAVMMLGLWLLVSRTQLGKAMRATAFDREAAAMMGINIDRVIASAFFIGSALAGAAGVMFGLVFNNIYQFMGFTLGLKGFTAAVVGGIGSIPGAAFGGLVIGVAESLSAGYLPQGSTFQDLWVFCALILVLLLRPTGLLGRADIKKV